jgi:hypothetical protein
MKAAHFFKNLTRTFEATGIDGGSLERTYVCAYLSQSQHMSNAF